MHGAILSLVDRLDWTNEDFATPYGKDLYNMLGDSGERGSLSLGFKFDGGPLLESTARGIEAFEYRIRLAVMLACAPREFLAQAEVLSDLLRIRRLPIMITALSMKSPVEVIIKGELKDVEAILNRLAEQRGIAPARRDGPSLARRFVKATVALFAIAGVILAAPTLVETHIPTIPATVQSRVQEVVTEACKILPDGSEVTVKFPGVEIKVPCGTGADRAKRDK